MTGYNKRARKYNINTSAMSVIDTKEKAYLLGWIATDGYIRPYMIGIQLKSTDGQVITDMLSAVFGKNSSYLTTRNRPAGYIASLKKTFIASSSVTGTIGSKEIAEDVRKHLRLKSTDKKSNSLRLPQLSGDLMWAMIRGIIEGDGTIRKYELKNNSGRGMQDVQIGIVSASKRFLQDLKTFLKTNGISGGKIGMQRKTYVFVIGGDAAFDCLLKIYHSKVPSTQRLERKYLVAKQWLDNRPNLRKSLLIKTCVSCNSSFITKRQACCQKYCTALCRSKFYKSKRIP